MNWDAIGAIGEIIGAIAVVASLIYLASQIRVQNNISLRDSRSNITDRWNVISTAKFENADIATLMVKLRTYSPSLTDEECVRANGLAQMYLNVVSAINSGQEAGMLSSRILALNLDVLSANIGRYPGVYPFIEELMDQVGVLKGTSDAFDRLFRDIEKAKSENGNQK